MAHFSRRFAYIVLIFTGLLACDRVTAQDAGAERVFVVGWQSGVKVDKITVYNANGSATGTRSFSGVEIKGVHAVNEYDTVELANGVWIEKRFLNTERCLAGNGSSKYVVAGRPTSTLAGVAGSGRSCPTP